MKKLLISIVFLLCGINVFCQNNPFVFRDCNIKKIGNLICADKWSFDNESYTHLNLVIEKTKDTEAPDSAVGDLYKIKFSALNETYTFEDCFGSIISFDDEEKRMCIFSKNIKTANKIYSFIFYIFGNEVSLSVKKDYIVN